MRVSIDDEDARRLLVGAGVRIFLDGLELAQVISADEEARTIERYRTDERGRVLLKHDRTGAQRETLHGTVRIELPPHLEAPMRVIEQARRQRAA